MKHINVEQNTDEWHSLRCGKVTASNFGLFMANDGKAFGDPAKKYAIQIALERITKCQSDSSYTNEHMLRGHEQEPIARMLYEETMFVDVANGGFYDCGLYGDSPDGLVNDDGLIEIKCVTPATHYATLKSRSFDPAYLWQLVGHLDCSGRYWVDFVSYCSSFPEEKQLIVFRLFRNDYIDHINRLVTRRNSFLDLIDEIQSDICYIGL